MELDPFKLKSYRSPKGTDIRILSGVASEKELLVHP
jgi:hypothetical protein